MACARLTSLPLSKSRQLLSPSLSAVLVLTRGNFAGGLSVLTTVVVALLVADIPANAIAASSDSNPDGIRGVMGKFVLRAMIFII
jgi:hypothetical protein